MPSLTVSWILLFAVLGLTFGSFGSVLVTRVPEGRSIGGRSRCPRCGRTLGAYDLVPLLSFIVLAGRCRFCKAPIGVLYPFLETASAALFVLALVVGPSPLPALLLAWALWLLLLIAVMDVRTRFIHDALNLSFILFAAAYALTAGRFAIAGAVSVGLFFGVQWLVSRGRWIGSGDILLGIGVGLLMGDLRMALLCLAGAYIIGALAAIVLLAAKRVTKTSHVPFAPFLASATLLVLLLQDWLAGFAIRFL